MRNDEFLINNILKVAIALESELEKFVFVGGSICPFLMENENRKNSRPTIDVDLTISVATLFDFAEIEKKLRKLGFKNDKSSAVLCRWLLNDLMVDIMPDKKNILGFTNSFYVEGIKNSKQIKLPNGPMIKILQLPWFFASKMEAYQSRGKNDPRTSHDIEDIILVLDSRNDLTKDLLEFPEDLRKSIRPFCQNLLKGNYLNEANLFSIIGENIDDRTKQIINFFGLI